MANLAFLQSGFLIALLAIAIPIAIHLIYRRKAIKWRFAAFDFLLRSHRRVARRLQIKQLLLLILRCLLYIILAIAFAKPFLRWAQDTNPSMPRALVIIVDDSMSMSYTEVQGSSLFDQARTSALNMLRNLRGEDKVALLRGSASTRPLSYEQTELSFDRAAVEQKLHRWTHSYRTTDLPTALRRAAAILQPIKGYHPQIAVFSDFARHAFDGSSSPKLPPLPEVTLFPIRPQKLHNRAIVDLQIAPVPIAGPNAYHLNITVHNFSDHIAKDLPIKVMLNNRPRVQGFVTIPPQTSAQKKFALQLTQTGIYSGFVEIGADPLLADNRYYFALLARQSPRILLINGDPRTIAHLDELFYLERALKDPRQHFAITTVSGTNQLPAPSDFHAIFLCNVSELPSAWLGDLQRFVERGGGLFISMGDQIDPNYYNQNIPTLLPRQLRHTALAAQRPDGTGIAVQRHFGALKSEHPLFRELYTDGFIFQSAQVTRLMLVEPRSQQQDGSVLWRYSHGPPALLERQIGKGRVLLWTTTIDRDWTNLPIRPFFMPWMHQVVTYLSGGVRFEQAHSLHIDQTTSLTKISGQEPIQIEPPSGSPFWLQPKQDVFNFPGGEVPGIYKFMRNGIIIPILPQIVNVDTRESDLTPIETKQLAAIGELSASTSTLSDPQSTRLWPLLFLFLILIFFTETLILRFL